MIVLTLRGKHWGHAIGVSLALLAGFPPLPYCYPPFHHLTQELAAAYRQWSHLLHGRPINDPLVLFVPFFLFSQVALVVALVAAYARLRDKRPSDLLVLLVSLIGVEAYCCGAYLLKMWFVIAHNLFD